MIQDRTSVFPKAFIELTLGLSDVLKVTLCTFYQVYEVFCVVSIPSQGYIVVNFSVGLVDVLCAINC